MVAERSSSTSTRTVCSGLTTACAVLKEGAVGEILVVDLEDVEDAVDDRIRGHVLWRGIRDAEALLKPAERRLIAVVPRRPRRRVQGLGPSGPPAPHGPRGRCR